MKTIQSLQSGRRTGNVIRCAVFGTTLAAMTLLTNNLGHAQIGTVVSWGYYSQDDVPAGLSNVITVAAGSNHALVIKSDGTVTAWGYDYYGQTDVPVGLSNVIAVAGGGGHSLALKSDGTVTAWGWNYSGQTNVPAGLSNIIAVAAGALHSLALKSDGRVIAWGTGSLFNYGEANVPVDLSNVIAIAACQCNSLALRSDGTVAAWGENGSHQTNVPSRLTNVIAIACGESHSLALKSDGTITAWGANGYGQTNVPTGLSNVIAVASGGDHSLALKSNGTVAAWGGRNQYGENNSPAGIGAVAGIAAGTSYSLALRGPALAELPGPTNLVVLRGATAEVRRGILGFKPQFFQWFSNNVALIGATNYVLRIPNVKLTQSGPYRVLVTNSFAALTSSPVTLTAIDLPPQIATQSASHMVPPGASTDLAVAATGSQPMTYQWYFNSSTPIQDATNSSLHLASFQADKVGSYFVIVTNLFGSATSAPIVLNLGPSNTVANCTEANLRAALAGGGTVTFACDGTITLSNTISINLDTFIDGTGHQISISGSNTVRVFYVSTNVPLTLSNLTIANGCSTNGGGIYNDDGDVTVQNCIFSNNFAVGPTNSTSVVAPAGQGGAIFSSGNLVLQNCFLTGNKTGGGITSVGFAECGDGQGGAIFNLGTNVIDNCTFWGNYASGANAGSSEFIGGGAAGGAIYNAGSLTVSHSSFTNNYAYGGAGKSQSGYPDGFPGYSGGAANGGAIFNSGVLQLKSSVLALNVTTGGNGGMGDPGGMASDGTGTFGRNGGYGGNGGNGFGAIFNSGTAILVNDTVAFNQSFGGYSGAGGAGGWGSPGYPNGSGGNGGSGGSAAGGICDTTGNLQTTNCTVAFNSGVARAGSSGGNPGSGPGLPGSHGLFGTNGLAAGGAKMLSAVFANTLLASNTPVNCSGAVVDGRCNLSSDASAAFTATDSRTNINPMLDLLADNGGPTLTMALLPGSPAIDAGSAVGAPATDQRGVPRPQGAGVDIGAFEVQSVPFFSGLAFTNGTNFQLQLTGFLANQTFTVQGSSNLLNWFTVTSFTFGTNSVFQLVDPIPANSRARFYRVKSGAP